jgi:hypothetical protein
MEYGIHFGQHFDADAKTIVKLRIRQMLDINRSIDKQLAIGCKN